MKESRRRRSDVVSSVDMLGLAGGVNRKKVGLLYGTADCKMLAVSGCTSVHPYKEDVKLREATPGLCCGLDGFWIENCNFKALW